MNEAYATTPEGMVDIPFIYTFDGSALTDASNVAGLSVPIDGDAEFLLRRIANVPALMNPTTGGFRFRNESREQAASNYQLFPNNYTVVPQKRYLPRSEISFDINGVLRRVRVVNCNGVQDIITPYVCFQGVRRKPGTGSFSAYESNYAYYERPFEYTSTFTLNTAAFTALNTLTGEVFHQFTVRNHDFELREIRVVVDGTGAAVGQDEFGLRLFDASGYQSLSDGPVPIGVLNANQGNNFFSAFPAPTLVYPVNSIVKMAVTSFLCVTEIPRVYQFKFRGVDRVPR